VWTFFKILVWGLAWYPVWVITLAVKGNKNNCLLWALDKFDNEGGYIVIRWSRSNSVPFIKWPHFLWLPEEHHIHLQHIVPNGDTETHKLPSPWFVPEHRTGDNKMGEN
jgi:hypothetical protein